MAYVQMKLVVAAVMYEFEVVVVNGGATAKKMMNPPYILSLVLKMKGRLAAPSNQNQDLEKGNSGKLTHRPVTPGKNIPLSNHAPSYDRQFWVLLVCHAVSPLGLYPCCSSYKFI
ncbi:hypothetical protein GBA52_014610 [Prunus armeniaca]|nr:hypothetical protein GBA52_014610 [Prunus armeniaca]